RRPIPDSLPAQRSIRSELHDEDFRARIAKLIGGETVSDSNDVGASVGCAGDAFRDVATDTAPCRFCEQRLALNAANTEGDRENSKKESFHGLEILFLCSSFPSPTSGGKQTTERLASCYFCRVDFCCGWRLYPNHDVCDEELCSIDRRVASVLERVR